jgi:hypothetical protein
MKSSGASDAPIKDLFGNDPVAGNAALESLKDSPVEMLPEVMRAAFASSADERQVELRLARACQNWGLASADFTPVRRQTALFSSPQDLLNKTPTFYHTATARLTDDLGRYRIYGLAPGKYIVSAAVGDVGGAELPGYTRSYFPGGANAANAQFVSIDVGQQITGVDFGLERARTAVVSGRLLDAAGEPTMGGAVRLIPSQASNAATSLPANARLDRDGHFEFPNVTPGQYVVQVDRGRRNSSTEGEFGALPVAVDGVDVTGLVVRMSAGSSISGRVTLESFQGTKEPRRGQIEIVPVPIDADQSTASPANADIHEDWTFEMTGINGPRRLQLQQAPPGWTLKAIKVRGIDVTDRPLPFGRRDQSLNDVEVVLTDRLSGVGGTIVDGRARPAAGAHVVVFPIDRARWFPASRYLRTAVAADDGAIALAGLPAGSYYAAAVAQLPPDSNDAWQDPVYLESLVARAASFALGEGQKQVLKLTLPDR